jgi:tetratricopeptide (TPR) repeat protein
LQQGLGPTGNAFQLQLELMDLELASVRKNLDHTEARLQAIREKSHPVDETTQTDGEDLSERELQQLRNKLLREINSREIEIFRMKADRFPGEMSHRIELGTRLLKADLIDEAISELQQARKDERLKWKAAMLLGICFKRRNHWRLAQRNFEEALEAIPGNEEKARKELLFELASGCAENGDLPRALDLGHELANLDFSYKNIGKLLDEWNDRLQSA